MPSPMPSFAEIVDPGRFSLDEAEKIAQQLMAEGQRIPERCALALQAEPPPDNGRAERLLELLQRITTPERLLPLLDRVMPSSNARIRSKAWKLYAAASSDLHWALGQVEDEDARVAANVVEALWRAKPTPALHEIFRRAAMQNRNRVAGNGLVGLFSFNDPAAPGLAREMACHWDAAFRATAAWVIGRVYWLEGTPLLRELRNDPNEKVRQNAARSAMRLARRFPGAA